MKLGIVTYNMGKDMDCPALIKFCKETGLAGVELRTTHAHKVELNLDKNQRNEVKKMFADSGIEIAGLGTTCEFHSKDPAEVKKNIEESIAWAQLAADLGSPGIKVRPNGLRSDVPPEKTLEQIGLALRQVATFAEGIGVQVRLEVHGKETSDPPNIRKIMDFANHPNALVCWNSNSGDQDANGSIQASFDLLKDKIALVHITEIGIYQYPWRQLFDDLKGINYPGYCLAEIAYNAEPERFMKYYRTLFDLYTGNYKYPQ
ncbi:MAG: sugar phosphate isomerase/epimerase, partial [Candidatus Hydrogenedentes bacterium]|nr:sugar phosphate isomerase/epimerase [Candidatus Hydrogenedentota bacterium]